MSIKKNLTEEEVLSLIGRETEAGFNYLYDHYASTFYGIVLKIVFSEDAAQDVLQDGFVKIWKNISNYERKKGTLFTWMLNIIRNTAIDYTRSKHVRNKIRIDDEIVGLNNQLSESKNFDHIGMKEVIVKLKEEHKVVIEALYFSGYTQEEASKKLNLPLGTLKTRARTAIMTLRNLLKEIQ